MRVLLLVSVCLVSQVFSSDTLELKNGRMIILNDNYTWNYMSDAGNDSVPAKTFYKQVEVNNKAVSKKFGFVINYNDNKYSVKKQSGVKEFFFQSKDQTIFLQTIAEKAYLVPDVLVEAAIVNAKNGASDVVIEEKGIAELNGLPAKTLIMKAKIQNYEFTYYGCYYSSPEFGSIQLLAWTYSSLFDKVKPEIEKIFGGFEIPGK